LRGLESVSHESGARGASANLLEVAMKKKKGVPEKGEFGSFPAGDEELEEYGDEEEDDELYDDELEEDDELDDDEFEEGEDEFEEYEEDEDEDLDETEEEEEER
jgi:hypothetical protein